VNVVEKLFKSSIYNSRVLLVVVLWGVDLQKLAIATSRQSFWAFLAKILLRIAHTAIFQLPINILTYGSHYIQRPQSPETEIERNFAIRRRFRLFLPCR